MESDGVNSSVMTNVYLSIVNDRRAREKLDCYKSIRAKRNESLHNYRASSLQELSKIAGVSEDFRWLSGKEGTRVWSAIINDVYGDELAGLTKQTNDSTPVTTIKEKEEDMSVTVKTTHTVNGNDVDNMTADQLIVCVKNLEKEIADLKAVKSESDYINKKVGELGITLQVVIGHLDSK